MSTKKQRAEAARLLGSAKTKKKAEAARRNAKMPRKKGAQKIEDLNKVDEQRARRDMYERYG